MSAPHARLPWRLRRRSSAPAASSVQVARHSEAIRLVAHRRIIEIARDRQDIVAAGAERSAAQHALLAALRLRAVPSAGRAADSSRPSNPRSIARRRRPCRAGRRRWAGMRPPAAGPAGPGCRRNRRSSLAPRRSDRPTNSASCVPARAAYSHSASLGSRYAWPACARSHAMYCLRVLPADVVDRRPVLDRAPCAAAGCSRHRRCRPATRPTVTGYWPSAKPRSVTRCTGMAAGSRAPCPIMKLPAGSRTIQGQVGQSWK